MINNHYVDIISLIDSIQHQYDKVNGLWRQRDTLINLKSVLVKNIQNSPDYLGYIMRYRDFLNGHIIEIDRGISTQLNYSYRVKNKNSVEYKIESYTNTHENGEIPVNKCLNDLLGFRIVVDDFCYDDFKIAIGNSNYKVIDASKTMPDSMEYIATHLYFRKGSMYFPWELQIWDKKHEKSNLASHEKYKQDYVRWEKRTKEH